MSTDGVETEVKIEELRAAVLKMETQAPVKPDDETKKLEKPVTLEERERESVKKLKAPELPEQVKRTQGIIASIHDRQEQRARLVAEGNSKRVQFQRATAEDQKAEESQIAAWEKELQEKTDALKTEMKFKLDTRMQELDGVTARIDRIDVSLEQLRKQLDAELSKMGAKVTA